MSDEPRPGSNAAIDSRIARLEADMALVKLEMAHQREIMTGRFGAIDASLTAVSTKLDRFLEVLSAGTQDVLGSPAGRVLAADIQALEARVETLKTISDQTKGAVGVARFLAAGGLLSGAAALITLGLRLAGN